MAEETFNEYTKQARTEFVNYINSLEWNNELRAKCEDLLIAYDQMKAKCDGMEDSNENRGLHKHIVNTRAFVENCAEMTKYIDGKHYDVKYKKMMIPVVEFNELRDAADKYDRQHGC